LFTVFGRPGGGEAVERAPADVVLTFGQMATDGIAAAALALSGTHSFQHLVAPHPAARGADVPTRLKAAAEALELLEYKVDAA